jgi:hypothetical protein
MLNFGTFDATEGSPGFIAVKIPGIVLSIISLISSLYLWITGFKRFERKIGSTIGLLLYLSFNIMYAIYLQIRIEHDQKDI